MIRYEVEATQFVVRVYDETHPDNYIAHALIRVYGDRGWLSSMLGTAAYKMMADHVADICRKCGGIKTLEGYMTKAHVRLLRASLRGKASVSVGVGGECAERDMTWVVVRPI